MSVHDATKPDSREASLEAAVEAIRDGRLIVLPTDTVYGIGADAFDARAVEDLLAAKGRGRDVPPPVLVADPAVLMALAVDVPEVAEQLAEEFWPGALTLILEAQPSLQWDLGETRGTVALRMPDDEIALDLLRRTGPLAVSSANRHGKDAARSVLDAATQLGDAVEVYLDGGPARIGTSSTIIDCTVDPVEIVREGALTREAIVAALGDIFTAPEPEQPDETAEEPDKDATVPSSEESALTTQPEQTADAAAADMPSTTEPAETTQQSPDDAERPQPAPSTATDEAAEQTTPSAPALALPAEPELEDMSSSADAPAIAEDGEAERSPAPGSDG